jgi:hypothetical protein
MSVIIWVVRSVEKLFTTNPNASAESHLPMRDLGPTRHGAKTSKNYSDHRFKYCTLSLLALAFLVFLSGTGGKLSLFHNLHQVTPPSSFTDKVWPETRTAIVVPAVSRLRCRSTSHGNSSNLQCVALHAPIANAAASPLVSFPTSTFASFAFLLPFRSPPAL